MWRSLVPPPDPEHIVKLAVGKKKAADLTFSPLEELLSEIIVGNAFGVDRMDYLLRDSHHVGVPYGRFDHYRLIDTLRLLVRRPGNAPELGVEEDGFLSAEALLIARHYMYTQVYFHPIRLIYDLHLQRFLSEWLSGGTFDTDVTRHLELTDNEVSAEILDAARDPGAKGHKPAKYIVERSHFKRLWDRNPDDVTKNQEAGQAIFEAAKEQFDEKNVEYAKKVGGGAIEDFPVRLRNGQVVSSITLSENIGERVIAAEHVYIAREREDEASRWLAENKDRIIEEAREEEA